MNSRIALERYVYEDIYPAFKATTDEKLITQSLCRNFLNTLASANLVLDGNTPAPIADIGSGPCDTLVKYLTGVTFPPGFVLRATDYLDHYAHEALRTLAAARAQNVIKIVSFGARAGDSFAGQLAELLSDPSDGTQFRHEFRIVFASHVIYHAGSPSHVSRMMKEIASDLLAPDGVCLLFHIKNSPNTFQDFRARFGSEAGFRKDSNTGPVTIDDPPAQIRRACEENRLPFCESEFTTRLQFGALDDDEWRAFEDPQSYDALAESNPAAYEDLKRLYFIVQRAPLEFVADRSPTGLHSFVDEIRRVLEGNNGILLSLEVMQVFTRIDADPRLASAIPVALANSIASASAQS